MSMIDLPILCILEHSVTTITDMHLLVGIASNQQELLISIMMYQDLIPWFSGIHLKLKNLDSPMKQTI